MSRYYLPAKYWQSEDLELKGDEAHHCTRVLRSKVGDQIEIFDGKGISAHAEILSLSKDQVIVNLTSEPDQVLKSSEIHLIQSIPKGGNMELIVQKAVELGISSIQPLITKNTIARPEQMQKKISKWQRIAIEACKQCGQNHLPTIHPVAKFSDWIKTNDSSDLKLVAALLPESQSMHHIFQLETNRASASFLIGPEGDFSDEEYTQILSANYKPVSLGNIILRVETATLYCLSVIKHELEAH